MKGGKLQVPASTPLFTIYFFQMVMGSGIGNNKIYFFSGWFSTRQPTRKVTAQAGLPIQGESSDR